MARHPDGREIVAQLVFPLPMTLAAELMRGIAEGAERAGYTDVVFLTDGTNRMVATPPGWTAPAGEEHPQSGPAAPEGGAPTAPSP